MFYIRHISGHVKFWSRSLPYAVELLDDLVRRFYYSAKYEFQLSFKE